MKIIIAGSRNITDYELVKRAILDSGFTDLPNQSTEIVSGMARGVDMLAVRYAREYNLSLYEFPADWNKYGRAAGMIRNDDMAQFADALIAIWDGCSVGTKGMIDIARSRRLKIFVVRTDIGTAMGVE